MLAIFMEMMQALIMDTTIKVLLYLVFALALSVGLLAKYASKKDEHIYTEGVYYMKYGAVYCGFAELTPCGVTLKKCANDKQYYCLHDLAMSEEYEDSMK